MWNLQKKIYNYTIFYKYLFLYIKELISSYIGPILFINIRHSPSEK